MIKQIIVLRHDLNMRKGKMIAMGCHASMKVLLDIAYKYGHNEEHFWSIHAKHNSPLYEWLTGLFTKIVVYVNSEEELLAIYRKAFEEDLLCSLIQDAGRTEFNGVPTYTCCAIGPDEEEKIDKITGHLPLL